MYNNSMLIEMLAAQGKTITVAESCTGGMVAAALTDVPGASAVFKQGIIAYSNEAKIRLLGVPAYTIERFGAVSAETAEAMAMGALMAAGADIAISVTGIAGPGGGTAAKPVGLVFIGIAQSGNPATAFHVSCMFEGERELIRTQSVIEALRIVTGLLKLDD